MEDIRGAARFLREHGAAKIGVIGFCASPGRCTLSLSLALGLATAHMCTRVRRHGRGAGAGHCRARGGDRRGCTLLCVGSLGQAGSKPVLFSYASPPHFTPSSSDGTANEQLADVATITCPVLAHFGEKDDHTGFADQAAAEKLRGQLQRAGVEHEVTVVPGAGHGFMNRTDGGKALNEKLGRPEIDEKRIADAWERVLAFFEKHLA